MKKFFLGFVTLLVAVVQGVAFPFSNQPGFWCPGKVVLENQQVVRGEINYDLKFNAVQVRHDGVIRTYTAERIAYFDLFDQVKHRDRHYIAIDHQLDEGYRRKTFFEVLTEGDLTVLRKTKYVRRPRVTEDKRAPHIYLNTVCKHSYYLFNEGEFFEVDDFKGQVLPLMSRHQAAVSDYIRQCKLKLRKVHEQMRVVHLYNQLCAQQANKGAVTEMR